MPTEHTGGPPLNGMKKEAVQLLRLLGTKGPMKKANLVSAAGLSRWRGDKALLQLETLMLVAWTEEGPAKLYSLTETGREVFTRYIQAEN